ncbi:hypothetical protein ABLE91_17390 [Aquabacter sp. CN5-332]|uniref:hypothetical protein n=1 Tax=Aquabacter sp. CN5-332 TaxID=3156608 RepID=UPI0032B624E2
MQKTFLAGLCLLASLFMATAATASSDDSWGALRQAVETACLKAASANLTGATATVDPFGSESFGLALLRGKPKGAKQPVMMICVYDKKRQRVELGGELEVPR